MIFYSHSKTVENTTTGTKRLRVHTEGVTDNALKNFSERISFDIDKDILKEYVSEICKYHDLGKYHDFFQHYLLKTKNVDAFDKQHARFGAYTLFEKHKQTPEIAFLLYYVIIHHHKSLTYIKEYEFSQSTKTATTEAIFEKQKATILAKLEAIKTDFAEANLEKYMHFPDEDAQRIMYQTVKKIDKKGDIQNYFLINYLFSLLIEADKLDASDTQVYQKNAIPSNLVDIKYPLGNSKNTDLKAMSQNQLRNYVRGQVIAQLDDPNILSQKLFTLTAPTGIGKTLTALDFALKLREKIFEKETKKDKKHAQIIYGLPFINIIEQSINVYKDILGENGKLLAHYQYADALGEDKDTIDSNDTDEEKKYNQALMSLDTWQSDVVITSFVQLLQTLIGNRNKLLKKFNHFAGSIIILDEVQTIRLGLQPLIGASLFYLAKFLDARIVMMTATKPKIFELAETKLFKELNISDKIQPKELLENSEAVFACFKRTKIVPLLESKLENEDAFLAVFKKKWTEKKSCLIVCNKVKRSIDVFKKVSENVENPMYYLSTNIVPAVRLAIIKQIKEDIANNKAPILVATQVVEAGVDLDFDMGFRDLASIDSIIQVAGRINRNNNLTKMHSPLYIIDFGDCKDVYDEITRKNALKILTKEYLEEEYLNMVNTYFETIENEKSFEHSREFFKSMQTLRYDGEDRFAVSKFKIIDDANYAISVFVELDVKATECIVAFKKLLNKEIGKQEFDRNFKKDFNQRIIAVPKKLDNVKALEAHKSWLLTDNILWIKKEELTKYYDKNTGFIRDKDDNTAIL